MRPSLLTTTNYDHCIDCIGKQHFQQKNERSSFVVGCGCHENGVQMASSVHHPNQVQGLDLGSYSTDANANRILNYECETCRVLVCVPKTVAMVYIECKPKLPFARACHPACEAGQRRVVWHKKRHPHTRRRNSGSRVSSVPDGCPRAQATMS